MTRAWFTLWILCALTVVPLGCNPGPPTGTVVEVDLDEFSVSVSPETVSEGLINFRVRNVGNFNHEFLVIRTDLAADALPTNQAGAYEENAAGTEVLDELENIGPGEADNLVLTLEAGHYALICNMVVSGTVHYAQGMSADFTVSAGQNP